MAKLDYKMYYEKRDEMLDYLKQNKSFYDPMIYRYMSYLISTNSIVAYDNPFVICLHQILSKFNVIKDETDFYKIFAKMLEELNLLNGNCCEVGAGIYPRLAEIISPKIKGKGFNLTIYDPKLSIEKLSDVTLVKEKFTSVTDVSKFDTLFGMFPCEATIPLVESAIKQDKNLLVALCDCDHSNSKYPLMGGKYWATDFCETLKKQYGDEIHVLNWPSEVEQTTPILYKKRLHNNLV